jgi:Tol biopolymer transport system component
MIWGIPRSKGGIVIRKHVRLILCILFSIVMLAACAKTTEIVTVPPPTDTQLPPTPTLEPSPTASSINEMPITERVSVASDGTQGNAESWSPTISADGRYVAFSSYASNLVEGDTNGVTDIFVHDRVTGETQRVSVASNGTQGNNNDYYINSSISADGRYVAFKSSANNLVEGDTNGEFNVFVHDRITGDTIRVTAAPDGITHRFDYDAPAFSADGRYVAFSSDTIGGIFMYDRVTGETTIESVSSDGTQGNEYFYGLSFSADGRYIAFKSSADNLVEGDTNGNVDCFEYDRVTGETIRASVASDGTQASCGFSPTFLIYGPSISADGRYMAFSSYATNLVERYTYIPNVGWYLSVYLHDLVTGETSLVSISSDGTQANRSSWLHAISADGRYVAFSSDATNLVEGIADGYMSIYLHDRVTVETKFVSISNYDITENFWGSSISADVRYIAFASSANNLVEGDTNGVSDIFVIDLWASK